MREVGIFGGSFNPVHNGHIGLARQMLELAALDEVWFMVSPLNPFKTSAHDLLSDDRRLELVSKALEGEPRLSASDYEFHLPKPSYTWKTLKSLRAERPDCHFTLIIGADNWHNFTRWAQADYLITNYPIVVYPREGYPVDPAHLPPSVKLVPATLLPFSSTTIRRRVKAGLDISGMVPEAIVPLVKQYYASL